MKKFLKGLSVIVTLLASLQLTGVAPALSATGDPTVAWTSPASGSTVTGKFTISASYALAPGSTGRIAKVCLTLDGNTFETVDLNGSYFTGCDMDYFRETHDSWVIDSTTWQDGPHIFTVQVTDSDGRSSAAEKLTVNSSNPSPTVTWTSPAPGSTVAGKFTISASYAVAPGSTGRITQVCLTADGVPLATVDLNGSYFTGCDKDYLRETHDSWIVDSSKWTNGTHTFTVQVTDSSGRISSIETLSLISNNVLVSPPNNGGQNGGNVTPAQSISLSCNNASPSLCKVTIKSSPLDAWPKQTSVSIKMSVLTSGYTKTFTAKGSTNGTTTFKVPNPPGTGFAEWNLLAFTADAQSIEKGWTRGTLTVASAGASTPHGSSWKAIAANGAAYYCKGLPSGMKTIGTWIVADAFGFSDTVHAYNFWNARLYLTMVKKSNHVVIYPPYEMARYYKCPFAFRVNAP